MEAVASRHMPAKIVFPSGEKPVGQVACRITVDQEKWLKENFENKSRGAEFILHERTEALARSLNKFLPSETNPGATKEIKALAQVIDFIGLDLNPRRVGAKMVKVLAAAATAMGDIPQEDIQALRILAEQEGFSNEDAVAPLLLARKDILGAVEVTA